MPSGIERLVLRARFLLLEAGGEPERGAGAERGFDVDLAAHHFHQLLADREAQAGAAVLARGRAVGLRELVEDPRLRLRADAGAGVADLEAQRDVSSRSPRRVATRITTGPAR